MSEKYKLKRTDLPFMFVTSVDPDDSHPFEMSNVSSKAMLFDEETANQYIDSHKGFFTKELVVLKKDTTLEKPNPSISKNKSI